jgi:hypothetical protein
VPLVRKATSCHRETISSDFIEVFVAGVGVNFDPSLDVYPRLVVNMPFIMQVSTFAIDDLEVS